MFESFAKWFSIFYHPSAWTHFLPDGDCLGFEKKCGAKWGWNPDRHKPHPGEQPGLSQLSSWRYFIEKFDRKSVLHIFPDTSYLIFWHNCIIWWKCNFFLPSPLWLSADSPFFLCDSSMDRLSFSIGASKGKAWGPVLLNQEVPRLRWESIIF